MPGDFVVEGIQEIFDAQSKEQDRDKRKALMRRAEQIPPHEDNAYPGLCGALYPGYTTPGLRNYHTTSNGQIQLVWEHIWCDPRC